MSTIYLGKGAYSRSNGLVPEIKCINQFVETTPTAETGVVLLPRPALDPWLEVGTGPIRALFSEAGVFEGDYVVVSDNNAYRVTSWGLVLDLGDVGGSGNVDIAGSDGYVVVANGYAGYYTTGSTLQEIVFPDDAGMSSVDYIEGYFIFARAQSQAFYWTAIGNITVDPLDFASAERSPDILVAVRVLSDEVWLFGEASVEVWVPTGDGTLPFERVNGRVFDRGCINRATVARLDDSLFWVGSDHVVYRAQGVPGRISTNSIEERIRDADKSNLHAWAFTWDGHLFYALTIDVQGTFVFDALTGQWCEFASYGRSAWRAAFGTSNQELVTVGDDETGQLWRLSSDVFLDGTDPIVIESTGMLAIAGKRYLNSNFAVDVAKGTAAAGVEHNPIEMRYSDDAGRTFSGWKQMSMGKMGEYSKRVIFRQLGQTRPPGRLYHVRMSSPVPYRLTKAVANELFP